MEAMKQLTIGPPNYFGFLNVSFDSRPYNFSLPNGKFRYLNKCFIHSPAKKEPELCDQALAISYRDCGARPDPNFHVSFQRYNFAYWAMTNTFFFELLFLTYFK